MGVVSRAVANAGGSVTGIVPYGKSVIISSYRIR
jgi:predicted Rossmann-fold nucleotide-binding protein